MMLADELKRQGLHSLAALVEAAESRQADRVVLPVEVVVEVARTAPDALRRVVEWCNAQGVVVRLS